MQACANEFLAMVTKGVVHAVYKVVTRSSFGVTGRHKASGDKWTFHHCVTRWHASYLGHQLKDSISLNAYNSGLYHL